LRGSVGRDAYTAAKGGVLSLTRSLAVEYAKHHIRVNALAPGPTLTERVKTFVAGDQRTDEKNLLGMAEPDDVAQAALFLASDESRRITGTIVPVDSGAGCSAAVFPCPASSRVEQFTPAIDIRGHSVLNSVAP
jgi:NAD(P)-dependent dehydrogenase (short-subunit alcohol dehydrogenase family)